MRFKLLLTLLCSQFYLVGICQNWDTLGVPGFTNGNTGGCQVLLDQSDNVWIQYYELSNNASISVANWNGSVWQNVGPSAITPALSPPIQSSKMAFDNSNAPYIVYKNGPSQGWKAGLKTWNGTSWAQVGVDEFTPGQAQYLDLSISSNNEPYVLYADPLYDLSVMKFDGSAWSMVGIPFFTPQNAYNSALALDANDVPYVCFKDSSQAYKMSVMKFNGTAWVYVGSAGFSPSTIDHIDIVINSNDEPIVIFSDASQSNKATAMKYNGTTWVNVGAAGFSAGTIWNSEMVIDNQDNIFATFRDDGASSKAAVYKFDGSAWTDLASNGLSTGLTDNNHMAVSSSGIVYASFRDSDENLEATVMLLCETSSSISLSHCSSIISPSGNYTYSTTGVYTDTIPNMNGCDSIITINATITGSDLLATSWNSWTCLGDTNIVYASMSGTPTFTWDNGLGTGDQITFSPIATTTYQVIGNDGAGCIDTAEITIEVYDKPQVILTQSDTNVCLGDSILVTNTGPYTYNWSNPLNDTLQSQWYTTIYVGPWYLYLNAFDSSGYCYSLDSVLVNASSGPSGISGGIAGNTIMYVNDNGYTYEWYLNGNLISGATGFQYDAPVNGNYVVFVFDSTGCHSQISWTMTGVGLSIDDESFKFNMYPVPFTDFLILEVDFANEIILQDVSGKIVYRSTEIQETIQIDTKGLKPGTYFMSCVSDGNVITKRIIKQ